MVKTTYIRFTISLRDSKVFVVSQIADGSIPDDQGFAEDGILYKPEVTRLVADRRRTREPIVLAPDAVEFKPKTRPFGLQRLQFPEHALRRVYVSDIRRNRRTDQQDDQRNSRR
jgi:hypothetical protein